GARAVPVEAVKRAAPEAVPAAQCPAAASPVRAAALCRAAAASPVRAAAASPVRAAVRCPAASPVPALMQAAPPAQAQGRPTADQERRSTNTKRIPARAARPTTRPEVPQLPDNDFVVGVSQRPLRAARSSPPSGRVLFLAFSPNAQTANARVPNPYRRELVLVDAFP